MTLEQVLTEFTVRTSDDVRAFIQWVVNDQHVSFHPDTPFADYALNATGESIYSDDQAFILDAHLDSCFDVCRALDVDIYEIGYDISMAAMHAEPHAEKTGSF